MSLNRLVPTLSVRLRIAVLALITVVGFAAFGFTYTSSERQVGQAFRDAKRAAALADASREFKAAVTAMRFTAFEFGVRPGKELAEAFARAHEAAGKGLAVIETMVSGEETTSIAAVRASLALLQQRFALLAKEQEELGFTDDDGVRGLLQIAGAQVERIVGDEHPWLTDGDKKSIIVSLLTMRRYEADYRLTRMTHFQETFQTEHQKFITVMDAVIAAPIMKESLLGDVKMYVDAFASWIAGTEKTLPLLTMINADAQKMLPVADRLLASAHTYETAATGALTASQIHTRSIMMSVGLAVVLLGLMLSWLIGRSITRPLGGLSAAMVRLAQGDTATVIPAVDARDEIGAMARTVIVFRDNAIERQQLAATQDELSRTREQRSEAVAAMIKHFEASVGTALAKLRAAWQQLETAATALNGAADAVSAEARTAETRVGAASENVTSAAGSAEELAGSIGEIAVQAEKSTEVSARVVAEARRTGEAMQGLASAATRIGEVIGLIQAIAGQTNLLALNATIEAARAGEAGRGFAVVASEVKSLASQTAQATEEIAAQIGAIQGAAADAAGAITHVNEIIEEMSGIAASVAASVEQQNAAVSIIAEGVHKASTDARAGAEAMSRVAGRSQDARTTAAEVKAMADVLAAETENLDGEVRRFLDEVRAA
jgi:methyl-accepting chemotaxis protein